MHHSSLLHLHALIIIWGLLHKSSCADTKASALSTALQVQLGNLKSMNQILKALWRVFQTESLAHMQCVGACVCICVCKGCRQRPALCYYLWNLQDYS